APRHLGALGPRPHDVRALHDHAAQRRVGRCVVRARAASTLPDPAGVPVSPTTRHSRVTSGPVPGPTAAAGAAGAPMTPQLGSDSVVAITVTWRRPELLKTLPNTLARQSRPVDLVIVVDNNPDRAVAELVVAYPGASLHIPSWHRLGSAGGFALGALTALA